ncbi:unnamed protein product [marine sediment metagenome]|uniref:Uncharacterized protein n=1 Tax=marine sediment metagenome TaxID=412755 RepID=X1REW2_9ZZZZ
MIIEPGTKLLGNLVGEFCSQKSLGKPPARVKLYSKEEYIEETGDDKTAARYSAAKDQISLSPDIVSSISSILHELEHHYQTSRDGAAEFDQKYDEYLKKYGYENNPYEVEARKFEMKWWPEFERLLKKKLEESGIA